MKVNYIDLKKLIEEIDVPIYVAGHENPDYDSIGSSLALCSYLNKIGKDSYVLLESLNEDLISVFGEFGYIKNEVVHDEFVLLTVDLNKISRLGIYQSCVLAAKMTINIDHHQNNAYDVNYTLSIPESTSTCEIIYNLFKEFDIDIDSEIAAMLYSGIVTDTQSFMYVKSSDTFKVCGELINYGFDSTKLVEKLIHERSEEDLNALKDMLLNLNYDGFHYLYIDTKKEIYSGFAGMYRVKKNMPLFLNLDYIELLVVFFQYSDKMKVSIRSKGDIRADKIAELFDGGGHYKASGYSTDKNLEDNMKIIKEYLKL